MERIYSEEYTKDRTRGLRRRSDVVHALRKRSKDRACHRHSAKDWYNNLHEYSKGKIHCSCPMCRIKTNDKKAITSERPIRDLRRMCLDE